MRFLGLSERTPASLHLTSRTWTHILRCSRELASRAVWSNTSASHRCFSANQSRVFRNCCTRRALVLAIALGTAPHSLSTRSAFPGCSAQNQRVYSPISLVHLRDGVFRLAQLLVSTTICTLNFETRDAFPASLVGAQHLWVTKFAPVTLDEKGRRRI